MKTETEHENDRDFELVINWFRSLPERGETREEAISFCRAGLTVRIVNSNETGECVWAIVVENSNGFWMDTCRTEQEAMALCKAMGWVVA